MSSDESEADPEQVITFKEILEVTIKVRPGVEVKVPFDRKTFSNEPFVHIEASNRKLERLLLNMPGSGVMYKHQERNPNVKEVLKKYKMQRRQVHTPFGRERVPSSEARR